MRAKPTFCVAYKFSRLCSRPSFCVPVSNVFPASTNPQVVRVNAQSVVAGMANTQSIWYLSLVELIRQPVDTHGRVVDARRCVPILAGSTLPFVTPINLFKSLESFLNSCVRHVFIIVGCRSSING